ncbi:MAG: histidine phosphatase family protein, partial [Acidimicrobiales bacterium]
MAPRRPQAPPATLVLFVRHGRTPTTGAVLPGRAKGLHLDDGGRAQAEAVAQRIAALGAAAPGGRRRDGAAPGGQRDPAAPG